MQTSLLVSAVSSGTTKEKQQAVTSITSLYAFSLCCGRRGWEVGNYWIKQRCDL